MITVYAVVMKPTMTVKALFRSEIEAQNYVYMRDVPHVVMPWEVPAEVFKSEDGEWGE